MSGKSRQLYRDPRNGKIAGVCAGLADYFGWETWLVRILVVSATLLGMEFFIVVYIAGWFILDKKPGTEEKSFESIKSGFKKDSHDEEPVNDEPIKVKAKIWQSGEPPRQAFHDIRRKFKNLEHQLRTIERYVTSSEFTVSREINKL